MSTRTKFLSIFGNLEIDRMTDTTIIVLSAISSGIALSGLVISWRASPDEREKRILFLIVCLFLTMCSVPISLEFDRSTYPYHMALLLPVLLSLSPALYFYVLVKTSFKTAIKFQRLNLVLPFIGGAVMFGYYALPFTDRNEMFVRGDLPPGVLPLILAISTFLLLGAWVITSMCYLVLIIRKLKLYRTTLKQNLSNVDTIELRWVEWLMALLMVLWIASAISLVSENLTESAFFAPDILYVLLSGTLLFLIAFASVPSLEVFRNQSGLNTEIDRIHELDPKKKYSKSSLDKNRSEEIATEIEELMRERKVYLEVDLSLSKLAGHLNMPSNFVSQSLNEVLNATFYDYVGRWRIEAAKDHLKFGELSITDIYLEVGFNSRSTFYKIFKTQTGLTPKQYRGKYKLSNHTE